MREFDLVSVDWDSVRLMQAGQFKLETFYHEELARWTLQQNRISGVLQLLPNGVSEPTPQGENHFAVWVRGCSGVGQEGYLIDIPNDAGMALQGSFIAGSSIVPLYVGVAKRERNEEPELHPSVDVGLLQCGGRRRRYRIASDNTDPRFDWLQIAQFRKTSQGLLEADPVYLPECLFLSSHHGVWKAQLEIQALANRAMATLQEATPAHVDGLGSMFKSAAAVALAGSLGAAAQMTDARLHPHAYMDRLMQVFAAQRAQLLVLPDPNLAVHRETLEQLTRTLTYLNPDWKPESSSVQNTGSQNNTSQMPMSHWQLGQAFAESRKCFEKLIALYPPLLQKLGEVEPPRQSLPEHPTVVSARQAEEREEPRRGMTHFVPPR